MRVLDRANSSLGAMGLALALLLAPSESAARKEVVRWTHPAPAGVALYRVHYGFVPRSKAPYAVTEDVADPAIDASGAFTHAINVPNSGALFVAVSAVGPTGSESGYSGEGLRGESGNPTPPPSDLGDSSSAEVVLWEQDFELQGTGSYVSGWVDTRAGNSLVPDDSLFQVVDRDGNRVLGTTSSQTNIHSHYLTPESSEWSAYELRGRMLITHPYGGIGVTLHSQYDASDVYYRIRRSEADDFEMSPHPDGSPVACESQQSGVVPRENAWYRFRVEVIPERAATHLNAKVWEDGTPEPTSWQLRCRDERAERLLAGTIGLWSMGPGEKYWDDLQVVEREAGVLWDEDFELQSTGSYASGWVDTGAHNSLVPDDSLFQVVDRDGNRVFGTTSSQTNIHSHYLTPESSEWSAYELRGRMLITHKNGGIGVTLHSQYDASDVYYRIRRSGPDDFEMSPHPDGAPVACESQQSGVVPRENAWYRFRVEVIPETDATHLNARVWEDGTPEPTSWQLRCRDERAERLLAGTIGLWSMGPGEKYWDDLQVVERQASATPPVDPSPPPDPGDAASDEVVLWREDFELQSTGSYVSGWVDTGANDSLVPDDSLFQVVDRDGNRVFGTTSSQADIHSHYLTAGSAEWSAYELRGRMLITHQNGGIGVTLHSQYDASDAYYRIRRNSDAHARIRRISDRHSPIRRNRSNGYEMAPHTHGAPIACESQQSGVVPRVNAWYRFRIEVIPETGATQLNARVWEDGTPEPTSWQLQCWDERADRPLAGTIGLWSMGPGEKYWDDLQVVELPPPGAAERAPRPVRSGSRGASHSE